MLNWSVISNYEDVLLVGFTFFLIILLSFLLVIKSLRQKTRSTSSKLRLFLITLITLTFTTVGLYHYAVSAVYSYQSEERAARYQKAAEYAYYYLDNENDEIFYTRAILHHVLQANGNFTQSQADYALRRVHESDLWNKHALRFARITSKNHNFYTADELGIHLFDLQFRGNEIYYALNACPDCIAEKIIYTPIILPEIPEIREYETSPPVEETPTPPIKEEDNNSIDNPLIGRWENGSGRAWMWFFGPADELEFVDNERLRLWENGRRMTVTWNHTGPGTFNIYSDYFNGSISYVIDGDNLSITFRRTTWTFTRQ